MVQRGWQPCLLNQSKKTKVSLLGGLGIQIFNSHETHPDHSSCSMLICKTRIIDPINSGQYNYMSNEHPPHQRQLAGTVLGNRGKICKYLEAAKTTTGLFFYLPPLELPQIVRWWFSLSDRQTLATQNSRVVIPWLPLKSSRNHHPLRFMRY